MSSNVAGTEDLTVEAEQLVSGLADLSERMGDRDSHSSQMTPCSLS
ncbi:hypothetical protein ACXR2T_05115 [Leucobacter sp. HY1910]